MGLYMNNPSFIDHHYDNEDAGCLSFGQSGRGRFPQFSTGTFRISKDKENENETQTNCDVENGRGISSTSRQME